MGVKLHGIDGVTKKETLFAVPYSEFKRKFYSFGLNPKTRTENFPDEERGDFELINFLRNGGDAGAILATKIKGEDGEYEYPYYDGHRRALAYEFLFNEGLTGIKVPVQINVDIGKDRALMLAATVSTSNGRDLTQSEKSDIFRRLSDFNWSDKEIAERCGIKSEQTVRRIIGLSYAIPEVRKELDADGLSQKTALSIVEDSHGDPTKQKEILKKIKQEKKEGKRTPTGQKKRKPKSERTLDDSPVIDNKPPKSSSVNREASILDDVCGRVVMTRQQIEQWYDKLNLIVEKSERDEHYFECLEIILGYHVIAE